MGREAKNIINRKGRKAESKSFRKHTKKEKLANIMNSIFLEPKQAKDNTRKENYQLVLFVIADGKQPDVRKLQV